MTRTLSLLAGVSMLALAGAANAGEPITLTSAQLDGVSAGGSFFTWQGFTANVDVDVDIDGNYASAQGLADAYGKNTTAEVQTFTVTTSYSSHAGSSSLSATDDGGRRHIRR